jgi:hypothetical protein
MINRHTYLKLILSVVILSLLGTTIASAQGDPIFELGYKPFGSFQGQNFDTVNVLNGYVDFHVPFVSYPQRGGKLKMDFFFHYLPNIFVATQYSGTDCPSGHGYCIYFNYTGTDITLGDNFQTDITRNCVTPSYIPSIVTAPDGSTHQIAPSSTMASDGSAYEAAMYQGWPPVCTSPSSYTDAVINRNGIRHIFGASGGSGFSWYEDPNGNKITENFNCNNGICLPNWTDSMTRT